MVAKPVKKEEHIKKPTKKPKVEHGFSSEARVAKELGSRLTPQSGAMVGAKSDSRLKLKKVKVNVESKSTTADSMTVKLSWLQKVHGEALTSDAIPALTVSFVDNTGKPKSSGDWVMLTLADYNHLMELVHGH